MFLGFVDTIPGSFCADTKSYRMGLLFTDKDGNFGAISVTGRSCTTRISKKERHILDGFYATLWCSVNRLPSLLTLHNMPESFSCRHEKISDIV